MTTGLFLIAAMLILGGGLATAGDRIGMKVGKARLSLFNMRPRQTATLITILTGGLISATTLGILFLLSEQLRTGVFELADIQRDLADVQEELTQLQGERDSIDEALEQSRIQQEEAIIRLQDIDASLQESLQVQEETEAQLTAKQSELTATQTQLGQADAKFQQTRQELQQVSQQSLTLRQELRSLQQAQQDQNAAFTQQAEDLMEQDAQIREKTLQLRRLEIQRDFLLDGLATLEQGFTDLRLGDVAVFRNQLLAEGVVRDVTPDVARQTVNQVLRRANQVVLQSILPATQPIESPVVVIPNEELEGLISQLQDGREYVIRILSAGNYLVGEPCVVAQSSCIIVKADAFPNDLIFEQNEVIAAIPIEASLDNEVELREHFDLLISLTQVNARQAGVLTGTLQIADGQDSKLLDFFDQLIAHQATTQQPLTLAATAAADIYTANPLLIELVALQNGIPTLSTIASFRSPLSDLDDGAE